MDSQQHLESDPISGWIRLVRLGENVAVFPFVYFESQQQITCHSQSEELVKEPEFVHWGNPLMLRWLVSSWMLVLLYNKVVSKIWRNIIWDENLFQQANLESDFTESVVVTACKWKGSASDSVLKQDWGS